MFPECLSDAQLSYIWKTQQWCDTANPWPQALCRQASEPRWHSVGWTMLRVGATGEHQGEIWDGHKWLPGRSSICYRVARTRMTWQWVCCAGRRESMVEMANRQFVQPVVPQFRGAQAENWGVRKEEWVKGQITLLLWCHERELAFGRSSNATLIPVRSNGKV